MMVYWEEKEYWLEKEYCQDLMDNERNVLYKEIWDGDRFLELFWFWNLDVQWILLVKCFENFCNGVVFFDDIQVVLLVEGIEEKFFECLNCYNIFSYKVKYVKGDFRNLVYIGYWDGWLLYKSGNYKCGVIEVFIVIMSK